MVAAERAVAQTTKPAICIRRQMLKKRACAAGWLGPNGPIGPDAALGSDGLNQTAGEE
jgi:hypothetical protein